MHHFVWCSIPQSQSITLFGVSYPEAYASLCMVFHTPKPMHHFVWLSLSVIPLSLDCIKSSLSTYDMMMTDISLLNTNMVQKCVKLATQSEHSGHHANRQNTRTEQTTNHSQPLVQTDQSKESIHPTLNSHQVTKAINREQLYMVYHINDTTRVLFITHGLFPGETRKYFIMRHLYEMSYASYEPCRHNGDLWHGLKRKECVLRAMN